ncbi:MAG TPA: hypothetical protein VGD43_25190, partial [Micromonospora sp.]
AGGHQQGDHRRPAAPEATQRIGLSAPAEATQRLNTAHPVVPTSRADSTHDLAGQHSRAAQSDETIMMTAVRRQSTDDSAK